MSAHIFSFIKKILVLEPYKIFFVLGAVSAFLGSVLWFGFQTNIINFYPRVAHSNLMFFAFLWSFIAGFLMTAIPKMTRAESAGAFEIALSIILVLLQILMNWTNQVEASFLIFMLQISLILYFGLLRILVFRKIPFIGFIFIPVGLIQAIIGCLLYLMEFEPVKNTPYILCGEALIFNLVLGLGSRLIPVISRLPNALSPDIVSKKEIWTVPLTVLLLFNLGIWLQLFHQTDLGTLLKISAITLASVFQFKILKKPLVSSAVGRGIKMSIIFMFVGLLLNLSVFGYGLAAMHLVYIGGFSLLTIMISFRVIVSHGGQDISYEVSSRRIAWISYLLACVAVLRFAGMFNYSSIYISLSIILLCIALILWLAKHLAILNIRS